MKKIIFLFAAISFFNAMTHAQAPDWLWAKIVGGSQNDEALSIAVSSSGNAIVAGWFESPSITFGTTTLTNANKAENTSDLFLVKYNTKGNVLWAESTGGANNDEACSVAADASGNSYVAGSYYSSSIMFGSTILTNASNDTADIFLSKCDVNGNILWAKSAGGRGYDYANSVAVDASGSTYLAGSFGSPTITFGSLILKNTGSSDMFLTKYSTDGNVLWAKQTGGAGSDAAYSVAVDVSGNIYIAGDFESSSLRFDSTKLTNAGLYDIFLAKYDSSGNELWVKSAGGTGYDYVYSIATDGTGNIYITGIFYSPTITFGSETLKNAGSSDIFLAKYDAAGNMLWVRRAGGAEWDVASSVAVDASGNSYIAGHYRESTIAFGSSSLTNAGFDDIFLAKYDTKGNVIWAKSAGGINSDQAHSVAVDASGNIYIAGYGWSSPVNFGSIISSSERLAGFENIFISKLGIGSEIIK
jgi:hypothetical protein